jgi:hypothetical protein|tara:strand:- start:653 stop:2179 length:1527 start_codon:yes stop_codon:yes gene_type:complete
MPFLSVKDAREDEQSLPAWQFDTAPLNFKGTPSDSETFNASLGMVIDEGLSVSGMLNREGLQDRNRLIDEYVNQSDDNFEGYISGAGKFNYSMFAEEKQIEGIKTDGVLREERNKILADRRAYSEETLRHGSGIAQFLGAATGYMLDPLNVLTMGYSGAVMGAKSLSVLGNALTTARNLSVAGGLTELAIQPLVFEHKQDIESPYAVDDAVLAIAATALGAGLIGGVTGGISGYLKSTREAMKATPELEELSLTPEVKSALDSVRRLEITLKAADEVDLVAVEKEFVQEVAAELTASAGNKLTRGQRKALQLEIEQLKQKINKVTNDPDEIVKTKNVSARKAKAVAIASGEAAAKTEVQSLTEALDRGVALLEADRIATVAEADLSRLEQGILSDSNKKVLDQIKQKMQVDSESKYLREYEQHRVDSNTPNKLVSDYAEPELPVATTAKTTQMESQALKNSELTEDYNRSIMDYNALDDIQKGETVAIMKGFDDELEGLESIVACSIA